ncbi:hypothetical protein U9M48_040680 [Paspalum notatum var. saurae]|uniref:Uncharacterized protein n=1 Tax=Paspalum notatum var. saurae TaxID=547442 RepID=A0AAQ3XFT7_PASNO
MEHALVSASMGVMKPLLSKLSKLLEEELVKLKGVRKQISFLRDELSAMAPTLEMLADAEQLDPQTKEWRDKLRELAYDLEDCIDDFMVRVDHERDGHSGFFKRFFNKLKKLKPRLEIANQIEDLKVRVVETSERHKRYTLGQLKHNSGTSFIDPRLQALHEDIEKLVGIDGPKKDVIELLNMEMDGSSAKLKVVSIAGCGGLGKTTLAKQVYDTIRSGFSCAAFVSVSRTPNVRKILIHIADGVKFTGINTQDDDEQQLIAKLKEHLHNKRYIVVIDDVWDTETWEIIKLALPNNDYGSRIITTTRSVEVAKCCSSHVYEMDPLSFDDSKRLFFKRAFGSQGSSYPHLEDVPDRILRKCSGLPLAIVTISSMLTNKLAKAEWDRVLSAIGSALANSPDAKKMTTILSMSYFDIPPNIITCLLYLSVFPEDYEIEKQHLINRWIAEGFIHEEEGRTKYEIGEGYFNDLINRSMIQPIRVKYGQAKACRVHDIILDYIKCKAAEENFVTPLYEADDACPSEYKVRRLCVSNHITENITIWTKQIMFHVWSLTIFGGPAKISLLPFSALRVLDLGNCHHIEDHHLESIEKLFHLKYLRLSSWLRKLPEEVGGLHYLQTLDIRGIGIEELPSSITKLQQLAHLYVHQSTRFPAGTIGQMLNLEELTEYGFTPYEERKSMQEFSKLTKLRTLEITWIMRDLSDGSEGRSQAEDIYNYLGNVLSSCNLHNLSIKTYNLKYPMLLDTWHPTASCRIRKLCVNDFIYKVPNWMGSLGNLSVLEMSTMCVRPEDVEILGEIPSLLFLKLVTAGGTNGKIVIRGSNTFRSLKYFHLGIRHCGTSIEFEFGSMKKLEHVELEFCAHQMERLNGGASSLGIQHLSALTKVEVTIRGHHRYDWNYDPAEDDHDGPVRFVSRAIKAATETLPNRPTALRHWSQEHGGGGLTEWFKIWQIREEQAEQASDGETEQEKQTKEEHERMDEEKTDEKEVAQQDASMGVTDQLLPKLSTLLEEEYDKLRGISKQIKFFRSELGAMSVALQVLADAEHLSEQMRR